MKFAIVRSVIFVKFLYIYFFNFQHFEHFMKVSCLRITDFMVKTNFNQQTELVMWTFGHQNSGKLGTNFS